MGSDMAVALGRATSDGHTLFAQNSSRQTHTGQCLCLTPRRQFSPGEKLRTQHLEIPQARQTYAVLGSKPGGLWGYTHGVNEHRVAAGCVALPTTLSCTQPGLLGGDLVRLLLERSSSARQAVDLLTDLLEFGERVVPRILDDDLEPAGRAEPLDRRGAEDVDDRPRHLFLQSLLQRLGDRIAGEFRRPAVLEVVEHEIHRAEV